MISIYTQSINIDFFPHANSLDLDPIAHINKVSVARPRGPTRRGGFVRRLITVLSAIVALLTDALTANLGHCIHLIDPTASEPIPAESGGPHRLGKPRREARPTCLQVDGPHARGYV
jgi:hypothetical protein